MNPPFSWLFALLTCALLLVTGLVTGLMTGCEGELYGTFACAPSCVEGSCGDDGCGGSCGTCGPGLTCGADDTCVSSFCGNGSLEPNEECDPAITAGAGVCSTLAECADDGSACTREEFFGSASTCDAQCKRFTIIACEGGDGCCPNGCNPNNDFDCSMSCGNEMIDPGETCDPPSSCPTEADCAPVDEDACTAPTLAGSPTNCNAECVEVDVTACVDADGCCPEGCDSTDDDDCEPVDPPETCGNAVLDQGETCDRAITAGEAGACPAGPADCDDGQACTTDSVTGAPFTCSAACANTDITAPANGDGCCPSGATDAVDDDCPASNLCGNAVLDQGEACDRSISAGQPGACPAGPADCDDGQACTTDSVTGAPSTCTATCANTNITAPANGDGCCPSGATHAVDNDCPDLCGNAVLDAGEQCDPAIAAGNTGACPADAEACDDMDGCTVDSVQGDAADCTASCAHSAITVVADDDGCCLPESSVNTDVDCVPGCLDYCTAATSNCTGANELYADLFSCMPYCEPWVAGNKGDQSGNSVQCRLYYANLARNAPGTNCPRASTTSTTCN